MSAYDIRGAQAIPSPALIYYRDIIRANTLRTIEIAGSAERLWPHIKTHKMGAMLDMQLDLGITRFKCATIAELILAAERGAGHALLAYPLVGPNIERFLDAAARFPQTVFYATGDDEGQLALLSRAALARKMAVNVFVDVNMGMNRTGVALDALFAFYRHCAGLPGLRLCGLHAYDGHIRAQDVNARNEQARPAAQRALAIREKLVQSGLDCSVMILGGTPTFPVHAPLEGVFLSPGTIFVSDQGYCQSFPDLGVLPGAAVLARVVSHPRAGLFTIDVGYKAICSDCAGVRGVIVGLEGAVPVMHSEEHWVFEMPGGKDAPEVGAVLYVIPTHICPTTALYPFAYVAENGDIIDRWPVDARDRI